ncbi:alcohol-forming fatty acyl-CoA reductase-like [Argentina anserina]|uniref:alcohol-forming fatty acyl-CoA reductase-like n=1 Tax=Argentina anserina TaxID=57926 RepID=UPI0021765A7A|nr:alcohol-forming fatty acyl-CoA reductase-like [Potentilla anserina]
MGLDSILGYLQNKTILITGATGFLGMVFVEKILRVQPNVKKLYLLIRASDIKSATKRIHDEIIGKQLFRVLREKRGADFDSFIFEKVVALPGDVTFENLGVSEPRLMEELCNEIQIIVNSAATTNFDERYDISLAVNTFGVRQVLSFAKKCFKLEMLLHVSTAYVCGERAGLIPEDSSSMNKMVKEMANLDFETVEKNLVKEKLNELKALDTSEEVVRNTMKDFGIKRARLYGWPNTYVFTKAVGEIFLQRSKDNLPLVIVRPPIVTSTYEEPFPGWIQGFRTIDSVIAGYCKGKLTCLLVDPATVLDMIPVDMLVNSIIVAMVVNANQPTANIIYQVGSSLRNPLNFSQMHDFIFQYFTKNPWLNKDGEPVIVTKGTILTTMATFRMYMNFRYMLPLKGLNFVNKTFGQYFQDIYVNHSRKLDLVMRLVDLYKPYMLFYGIFDDANTQKLWKTANESFLEVGSFNFDATCIDWEEYIKHTHIPGLLKHVLIK